MADARLAALRASVSRLRRLAEPLEESDLTAPAYPSEWTIADVLSHIGSGAVILQRRLEDALVGQPTPEEFAPGVWDAWNAKSPTAQRDDALAADADVIDRLDTVTAGERAAFSFSMGPMTLGFSDFVGLRLNEHAFHTWDIEVVAHPLATIPDDVAAAVVDNLEMIARFAAKPTGDSRAIVIATTSPERRFRVELTPESVTLSPLADAATTADITMPAEAFARLVYGRLDAAHTPAGVGGAELDILRKVFPGL